VLETSDAFRRVPPTVPTLLHLLPTVSNPDPTLENLASGDEGEGAGWWGGAGRVGE
jgi:hypothetical protein